MSFSPFPTLIVVLVTLCCFAAVVQGSVTALRSIRHPEFTSRLYSIVLALLAWLGGLLLLSRREFFTDWETFPPRILLATLLPIAFVLFIGLHRSFRAGIEALRPARLLHLQGLRVLVALAMWLLARDGHCPPQLTFEGLNYDFVGGLIGPVAGYAAFGEGRRLRGLALFANIFGVGFLILSIMVWVLSLPQVGALLPATRMDAYWPMVWVPGFVLPFFVMLHVFSLRQLLMPKRD